MEDDKSHDWEWSSHPQTPNDPNEKAGYEFAAVIALVLTVVALIVIL